jgi:hypothetical protein
VLGVHGYTLLDSIFMKPSEQSTLMEIFPSGIFTRDREVFARALGMRYVAWWNDQLAVFLPLLHIHYRVAKVLMCSCAYSDNSVIALYRVLLNPPVQAARRFPSMRKRSSGQYKLG